MGGAAHSKGSKALKRSAMQEALRLKAAIISLLRRGFGYTAIANEFQMRRKKQPTHYATRNGRPWSMKQIKEHVKRLKIKKSIVKNKKIQLTMKAMRCKRGALRCKRRC